MDVSTFKRYEIKYFLLKEKAEELVLRLYPHMVLDPHCPGGESYRISSIYFDTDDRYFIRHSMSRPLYKEKFRMRSYGGQKSDCDMVFLEIKRKFDRIVSKRRAILTLKQAEEFVNKSVRPEVSGYMNNQVVDEMAFFLGTYRVRPSAYIGYNRVAFSGKHDLGLRVTFDTDIVARRNELTLRSPSNGERLIDERKALMEIKFSYSVPIWLSSLLSEFDLFRRGYSKYGNEHELLVANEGRLYAGDAINPAGQDTIRPSGNKYVKDLRRSVSL